MKTSTYLACLLNLTASTLFCQAQPGMNSHAHQVQVIQGLVAQANSERDLLVQTIQTTPQRVPKSRIGHMLYAARDAQLNISGWSDEVLASLPSSDLEMEAFLEFTSGPGNERFQPFLRVYYKMAFRGGSTSP